METQTRFATQVVQWQELFDDRYGDGALTELRSMFEQPCLSFAEIAVRFGVTRERVRQWHLEMMPNAPRGHARQRLCAQHQRKRRLLEDVLFRSFLRHARLDGQAHRLEPVVAREGFRKRTAWLDGRLVALRDAKPRPPREDSAPAAFALPACTEPVDFIYYRLSDEGFLAVPRAVVPAGGDEFVFRTASAYDQFHNTFAAALDATTAAQMAS